VLNLMDFGSLVSAEGENLLSQRSCNFSCDSSLEYD